MAKLKLTLHGISCYDSATQKDIPNDLSVSTEKDTAEANIYIDESTGAKRYSLNLIDFSFKKQMYKPTEIIADIQLTITEGSSWFSMDRDLVNKIFKHKQVTLEEVKYNASTKSDEVLQTLGSDFYVHEVVPRFKPNAMFATLKIYSPDKLLDIHVGSRTFVSKKLKGDILSKEIDKYEVPYNKGKITCNADDLKIIAYEKKPKKDSNKKDIPFQFDIVHEHIFPYLVQYNETFHDLLARTCNRWGEFMYYENSKLNFGYNADDTSPLVIGEKDYKDLYYVDNGTAGTTYSTLGKYDYTIEEPDYTSYEIKRDPKGYKNNFILIGQKEWDRAVMKKFASFFKHSKNIPTFIGNSIYDDTLDLAKQASKTGAKNKKSNSKNFDKTPGQDEQYNSNNDLYNVFTEIDTKFKTDYYMQILGREMEAERNAICIDFDTTCPNVKLGGYISLNNTTYIVTEISSSVREDYTFKIDMSNGTVAKIPVRALIFKLTAVPKDTKGVTGVNYYPTVIPAGHFRMAEPQIATISDAGDPIDAGRLRIAYPWDQYIDKKDNNKVKNVEKSSPWIHIASNNSGKSVASKHYIGDKVMIDYINGNVERPYVTGVVASKGEDTDVYTTTPGGHIFKIEDDKNGLKNFMSCMFSPIFNTLDPVLGAIPGFSDLNPGNAIGLGDANLALGGGFELSDYYGIYKISGSSNWRSINIDSPWGKIFMNAFTGISISAPNGDIEIKGKNISIEAGNNLTLTSGTNVKNKIWGGKPSGFFDDVAAAVAKKLADLALSVIDLSTLRAAIEVVFRPVEGALRVKSGRFLMLEAGGGECRYPKSAYHNDKWQAYFEKYNANNSDGLLLTPAVVELINMCNQLARSFVNDYVTQYNGAVRAKSTFNNSRTHKNSCQFHSSYSNANPRPKICKTYEELKTALWADGDNLLTEDDMGFPDEYKADVANVPDAFAISTMHLPPTASAEAIETAKQIVVNERNFHRLGLLSDANEIRKYIIGFKKATTMDKEKIKALGGLIKKSVFSARPGIFNEAIIEAFDKTKWGDSRFEKAISDDQKNLSSKLDLTTDNNLLDEVKALKRKAAILAIEKLGFKDEWRVKIPKPSAVPAAPGAPVELIAVARKFNVADLKDDTYWSNYVDSLGAVAPLKLDNLNITKNLKKSLKSFINGLNIIQSKQEIESWKEAKDPQILFSTDSKIFGLGDTIKPVTDVPSKGKITENEQGNGEVTNYLTDVKNAMKALT